MPSSSSSGSRRVVNTQACVVEDLQRRLKEAQNRSLGMPVKGQERSIVGVLGEFYRRRTANPNELTVPGLVGGCACARVSTGCLGVYHDHQAGAPKSRDLTRAPQKKPRARDAHLRDRIRAHRTWENACRRLDSGTLSPEKQLTTPETRDPRAIRE
jgi:hypothetical protein